VVLAEIAPSDPGGIIPKGLGLFSPAGFARCARC